MATFRAAFSRHLRVGTSTALAGGALLGLGVGLWLVMLDDSVVLFPTMWSRVMMVAFLASLFALTASAALIPLELVMAGFATRQPSASQVHARTFYAGALAIGVAAL